MNITTHHSGLNINIRPSHSLFEKEIPEWNEDIWHVLWKHDLKEGTTKGRHYAVICNSSITDADELVREVREILLSDSIIEIAIAFRETSNGFGILPEVHISLHGMEWGVLETLGNDWIVFHGVTNKMNTRISFHGTYE